MCPRERASRFLSIPDGGEAYSREFEMVCQPVLDAPLLEGTGSLQAGDGRGLLESHYDLIQQRLRELGRRSGRTRPE